MLIITRCWLKYLCRCLGVFQRFEVTILCERCCDDQPFLRGFILKERNLEVFQQNMTSKLKTGPSDRNLKSPNVKHKTPIRKAQRQVMNCPYAMLTPAMGIIQVYI